MSKKEYELATALQALLLAVVRRDENGKDFTADQIYGIAGYQAVAAIKNATGLDTWHDEIIL